MGEYAEYGASTLRSGVPHLSGLHGQPGRVTRLGGINFPHVNPWGGVAAIAVTNHNPAPRDLEYNM